MRSPLKLRALSVRQPWAWAIIHAGKDIENRGHVAIWKGAMKPGGRIAIHASKGMTKCDYIEGYNFMRSLGILCPPAGALIRGAVIGSVEVTDIVTKSASPWFFGPRGLVLRDPEPCEPIAAGGQLGFFVWSPGGEIEQPLKWMQPKPDARHPVELQAEADLFKQLTTCHRPEGER
ncbi:hypothetical protein [Bradyrhizobium sp. BR 10261]|uniref:hypothetical protein n=1 Tax=Bradyrhizobium sp. BR 10261 TaxID=2749992 RepID=UPI001C64FF17|nr:hypothetical protein [Bradyrhizobium sp. BR 10261]MBW7966766.1 hypothetical protein [Bradyrhizobium sp. BR 10261]